MLRRFPTARPRSPRSRVSWVNTLTRVVPALAGNPNLSAPSSFEPQWKPQLVDDINHAFGPFSPERTGPGKGAVMMFDGISLRYRRRDKRRYEEILNATSANPLEIKQAFKTARDIWIRALWASRRASCMLTEKGCNMMLRSRAVRLAQTSLRYQFKIDLHRGSWMFRMSRRANEYMERFEKGEQVDPVETRWLRELNGELVNRWWGDFSMIFDTDPLLFTKNGPVGRSSYNWDQPFHFKDDLINYICNELRHRFRRADSGADRPLLIQSCDPLSLAKQDLTREQGLILYAEESYDPNEKWVKIWDGMLPGETRRMLVVPSHNFSAALDFFLATNYDSDFKNDGYVPMKDWLDWHMVSEDLISGRITENA